MSDSLNERLCEALTDYLRIMQMPPETRGGEAASWKKIHGFESLHELLRLLPKEFKVCLG